MRRSPHGRPWSPALQVERLDARRPGLRRLKWAFCCAGGLKRAYRRHVCESRWCCGTVEAGNYTKISLSCVLFSCVMVTERFNMKVQEKAGFWSSSHQRCRAPSQSCWGRVAVGPWNGLGLLGLSGCGPDSRRRESRHAPLHRRTEA